MANEKRLIDADALKREIRKMPWAVRKAETNGKEEIEAIINDTPTVDAVEVVRCKDCKNYQKNQYSREGGMLCKCWADWLPTDPDDFCSYGERRTDDAEN